MTSVNTIEESPVPVYRMPLSSFEPVEPELQPFEMPPSDPVPLAPPRRGISGWIGTLISAVVLIACLREIARLNLHEVWALVPESVTFWAIFALSYFITPASEWVIFRRLWRLPPSGFLALVRKRIGNEILLGYIGEVYFYSWARRHGRIVAAPFGAVKDVAILSGIVGNMATLVLVLAAHPLLAWHSLGFHSGAIFGSVALLLIASAVPIRWRRHLFSLPPSSLRFVVAVHVVRLFLTTSLTALLWHLALPQVALNWWLLLSALRLLVSRLPFLPNKDFVFAGVAVALVGHDAETAALMAMLASMTLAAHLLLGAILTASELTGAEDMGERSQA